MLIFIYLFILSGDEMDKAVLPPQQPSLEEPSAHEVGSALRNVYLPRKVVGEIDMVSILPLMVLTELLWSCCSDWGGPIGADALGPEGLQRAVYLFA